MSDLLMIWPGLSSIEWINLSQLYTRRLAYSAGLALVLLSALWSNATHAQNLPSRSQAIIGLNRQIQSSVSAGAVSDQETVAALRARRNLLMNIMRNDPGGTKDYALDDSTRTAIVNEAPDAASLLERNVTITGELVGSIADDFQHETSKMLFSLHTANQDFDLSFVDSKSGLDYLLHHQITVSGISLSTIIVVDSLREATPTAISKGDLTPRVKVDSTTVQPDATPAECSSSGPQRIAALVVTFPNNTPSYPTGMDQPSFWNNILFGPNPSVNGFWNEVSYGQTSATGNTFGPFALSQSFDCTTTGQLATAAIAAAAGTVDFTQYDRIIIIYPASSCSFGGFASIGCSGATSTIPQNYSTFWLPVTPNLSPLYAWGLAAHELGHNLGLNHASTLDFGAIPLGPLDTAVSPTGTLSASPSLSLAPISATSSEYGDYFSAMGNASGGGPYSAEHRSSALSWIGAFDQETVLASGTYVLAPAENSSGMRTLRVLRDPVSSSWLSIEYHQPTGFYTPNNIDSLPHLGVTSPSTNNLTKGAQVHYASGYLDYLHTYLLDMTPTASPNNFVDGALEPGKSWSDPYSPLDLSIGEQTPSGLEVQVTYNKPCASASLSTSEIPLAGGTASLDITASSSCTWSVSSNADWVTFSGATNGSGNAIVPIEFSANTTTTQRNTFITVQRQSLPVVQDGPALTFAGVDPVMGTGASQVFTFVIKDGAGVSDFPSNSFYFILGNCYVSGEITGTTINAAYLGAFDALSAGSFTTIVPGSNQVSSNDICSLNGANSSVEFSGNTMTVKLDLSFSPTWHGAFALTADGGKSGTVVYPQPLGTFIVNGAQASATPSISPSGGTYTSAQSVSITDSTSGATVYYTTDGTPPTTASTQYTGPFTVSQSQTVKAIADASGQPQSAEGIADFIINLPVPTVTVTPSSSSITTTQTLSVTVTVSGTPTPTGTVTLSGGGYTSAATTLSSGSATINIPANSLSAGTDTLTAGYTPDSTSSSTYSSATGSTSVTVTTPVPATFNMTALPTTVAKGSSGTTTVTVSSTNGYVGIVSLSCKVTSSPANAVNLPTCTSSQTVTLGSSTTSGTATVNINTTAASSSALTWPKGKANGWEGIGGGAALAFLSVLWVPRRRRAWLSMLFILVLITGFGVMIGCSGGGTKPPQTTNPGTTAGIYTVTVTGAGNDSANTTATATFTLTVN